MDITKVSMISSKSAYLEGSTRLVWCRPYYHALRTESNVKMKMYKRILMK